MKRITEQGPGSRRIPSGATYRVALLVGLGVGLGGAAGCSVMLDPERLDDVPRCELDVDCEQPEDERFEAVCANRADADDADVDVDGAKVCIGRAAASCAPEDYAYDHVFRARFHEALSHPELYEGRCGALAGVRGCGPGPDGCAPGLEVHSLSKRCDDTDPGTPPALAPEPHVTGQDVRDQFCRSLYCDMQYVCDGGTDRCRPCELGKPLGNGGCGELYFAGVRSTVYQDADELQSTCEGIEMTFDDVEVGPIPVEESPYRGEP